jgi:hypothetical protein
MELVEMPSLPPPSSLTSLFRPQTSLGHRPDGDDDVDGRRRKTTVGASSSSLDLSSAGRSKNSALMDGNGWQREV